MKSKLLFGCCLLLILGSINAQEITKQEKGYFNLTEVGYFSGNQLLKLKNGLGASVLPYDAYGLSLRTINGVFVNNHLSLGVGLGIDNYSLVKTNFNFDNTFLLFADVRYYLKNVKNTFFAYTDFGSSLAVNNYFEQGLMFGAGAGYKFMIAKRTALNASLGYNEQYVNLNKNEANRYATVAFKVGFLF